MLWVCVCVFLCVDLHHFLSKLLLLMLLFGQMQWRHRVSASEIPTAIPVVVLGATVAVFLLITGQNTIPCRLNAYCL